MNAAGISHLYQQLPVQYFISDVNGHPRSIDEIVSFLQRYKSYPGYTPQYSTMLDYLMTSKVLNWDDILAFATPRAIAHCVLGEPVDLDWNYNDLPVAKVLESGFFQNSVPEAVFVPRTSILMLRAVYDRIFPRHNTQGVWSSSEALTLLEALGGVVLLETSKPVGLAFEEFVIARERLVRAALKVLMPSSSIVNNLLDLYGSGSRLKRQMRFPGIKRPDFHPEKVFLILAPLSGTITVNEDFPSEKGLKKLFSAHTSPLKHVIRGKDNQKGHDLTVLHMRLHAGQMELVALSIECKFTGMAADGSGLNSTTLTSEQINSKLLDSISLYQNASGTAPFSDLLLTCLLRRPL